MYGINVHDFRNGSVIQQDQWKYDQIKHEPVAPVLIEQDKTYIPQMFLSNTPWEMPIIPWEDNIPLTSLQGSDILEYIKRLWAVEEDQIGSKILHKPGMPLTGRSSFQIKVNTNKSKPDRALLILVYTKSLCK